MHWFHKLWGVSLRLSKPSYSIAVVVCGYLLSLPGYGGALLLPSDVPSYAQITPDGELQSVTRDAKGVYIIFTTRTPPARVIDFYKQAAERNGMTSLGSSEDDDGAFLQFANKHAFVVIALDKAGGGCLVRLRYHEDDPGGKSQ